MPNIRDNAAQSRFERDADGKTAFVAYKIDGGAITLPPAAARPAK